MRKDRFYKSSKGQYVPSGTTVIGLLDKPFLVQWSANCAVDYVSSGPLVTKELIKEGDADGVGEVIEHTIHDWDINDARTAYEQESTEAADYGTYIHTLCQYSLENDIELESPHEMTDKFMKGLWKWKTKHNVGIIAMEHEVITDTYGGRLDLVCEMDSFWMTKAWCKRFGHEWYKGIEKQRVVVLVDFKTGKGTYYDTWKWQLSGYRQAWNEKRYDDTAKDVARAVGCSICPAPVTGLIQHHGVLKFNKDTMKVNYKDFTEYEATRTISDGNFVDGKLETEKYIRRYEDDKATFNALVSLWHLTKRGVVV